MNKKKAAVIEKRANEARQKLINPDACSIDMKELVKAHGIRYFSKKLPNHISGASMTTERGEKIIVVNKDQPDTRKKFTIAHEIGHLILNHDTALNTQDKAVINGQQREEPSQILFRNDKTPDGSDWREVEANHFAATLLMPERVLDKQIQKLMQQKSKPYLSESDVFELANSFKVSAIAMSIRLSRFGFI